MMIFQRRGLSCLLSVLLLALSVPRVRAQQSASDAGWTTYSGGPGGDRYSSLSQINRATVKRLKVAWTYRTGAMDIVTEQKKDAAFEATPILASGKLFLSTPYSRVIALNPAT